MKIRALETIRVALPLARPIRTAIHELKTLGCVLVRVLGDDRLAGEGIAFVMGTERVGVLDEMIRSMAPRVVGADPDRVIAIWSGLWRDINFLGHKGVTICALSAIDTAIGDLRAKAIGQPMHRLLGSARSEVPVYASGGLWLDTATDRLGAEAREWLERGFRAMKLRIGSPSIAADLARVAAVREAIGREVPLMVDANQGFTVYHAIRLGRRLEAFDLTWFEEPVAHYDYRGSAEVAAALDTPIASGETDYTRYGFRAMIEARAADVLMPDLMRVGGVTEFLRVAHLAAAYELPVSSHLFSEQSVSILASLANATWLEHMPWFERLYSEKLEIRDGKAVVPERPGFGFSFDLDAIERLRIK